MTKKIDSTFNLIRQTGVSFLSTAASIVSAGTVVSLALAPKAAAQNYCIPREGVAQNGSISRGKNVRWDQIGTGPSQTCPTFDGGELNFRGFSGGDYDPDFEILEYATNTINNDKKNPHFTGKLYGRGGMIFEGRGHTRLSGLNTFTGRTLIKEGKLVIVNNDAAPSREGQIFIDYDGSLMLEGNDINIQAYIEDRGGTIEFLGKRAHIQSMIKTGGLDSQGVGRRLKFVVDGSLTRSAKDQNDKYIRPLIEGSISGEGGIAKTGGGSLTLGGINTYTGPTIVRNGTLEIGKTGSLSNETNVLVEQNAKIAFQSSNTINALQGEGTVELDLNSRLSIGGGLDSKDDFVFGGSIVDGTDSQGSITKLGQAMLTLSGNNAYTGETIITSGILRVDGTLSDQTAVDVKSSAVYKVANSDTIGSITGSGSIQVFDGKVLSFGASGVDTRFSGVIRGKGGIGKVGSDSMTTLSGVNTYLGHTNIAAGTLTVTGLLPDSTAVSVSSGATYDVDSTDTIGSIAGAGSVELAKGITLTAGGNNTSTTFSGDISGDGDFTKNGSGTFSISSDNSFQLGGTTTAKAGTIDLGKTSQVIADLVVEKDAKAFNGNIALVKLLNNGSIKVASLSGTDAANEFTNDGSIEITTSANIDLKAGNDVFVTNSNLTLSGILDGGEGEDLIRFGSSDNKLHPFRAASISSFERAEQTSGTWDYNGNFKDSGIETMTLKGGVIEILDSERAIFKNFVMEGGQIIASLDSKNSAPLTADSFDYKNGSLLIKDAGQHDPEGIYTVIDAPAASQGEMNELAANSVLEYDNMKPEGFNGIGIKNGIKGSAIYDVFLKEGSLQLVIEQKHHADILDCLKDDSCEKPIAPGHHDHHHEIKPGRPGHDILTVILDDILKEIDLPIIGYGTLAKLTISGLAPRNIDGPGRGMATYNNLLADTLFERLPLRQFDPVVIDETVVEQQEVIEEDSAPSVRGLWSKSGEVSDQDAQQSLDNAIAQNTDVVVEESTMVERLKTAGFVEAPSLAAQYARRDGVRAWFRAFGGDDRDSFNDNFHNPYYVNSGGGVLGIDASVSDSFQVGAFVNYGNINLIQQGALAGGGSWNSDGWGGGVRADYWTDNFYVQGLFSATGFSGNQRRDIVEITSELGDDTASGTKSSTSYGMAFRVGAPFEAGDFLIEPQFTSTWSFNNENRFTERGADQLNLTYKNRATTYVQTDLAMKFAYPIKTGDTSQFVPSLRVGWLGDWSDNLSNQTIGYQFTDDTVEIKSKNKATNGLLLEAGLDYTIANINSSSYKVYLRGGIEAWGGDRGTDYRTSGGFEWQF